MLVGNGQLLATFSTAGCQYTAAVLGSHALAEAMLVHATTIVRLECSFHCFYLFLLLLFFVCIVYSGCKSTHNFRNNKELSDF